MSFLKGEGSNHEEAGEDQSTEVAGRGSQSCPLFVTVSREHFESRMRNVAFRSWDDLVQTLSDGPQYSVPPQGAGMTIVKVEPMVVFAWVATLLIELCIWGIVAYCANVNLVLGLVITALYGAALWYIVSSQLAPQLAGMIWPNLPCAVAAAGALLGIMLQTGTTANFNLIGTARGAGVMLFCSILPQTLAAAGWMTALPRDPDRAVLVTNLFLGVYAALLATYVMAGAPDHGHTAFWFTFSSLLLLGVAAMAIAGCLYAFPSRWASVELISWTLNVGTLAVYVAATNLLNIPGTQYFLCWVAYVLLTAMMGALGTVLGRTFPVLLSAFGVAVTAIRISVEVGMRTGEPLAIFGTFGVLGVAVIAGSQLLCRSRRQGGYAGVP